MIRNYPRLYKFYINRFITCLLTYTWKSGFIVCSCPDNPRKIRCYRRTEYKIIGQISINDSKNIFELYLCLYSDLMLLLFKREMNYEMCSSLINKFYLILKVGGQRRSKYSYYEFSAINRAFKRLIYLYAGFWWFGIGPFIHFSSNQSFRWFLLCMSLESCHMTHV